MAQLNPWKGLPEALGEIPAEQQGMGPLAPVTPQALPQVAARKVSRAPAQVQMIESGALPEAPKLGTRESLIEMVQKSAERRERESQALKGEVSKKAEDGWMNVNLKPLLALADTWNGTNMAASYDDPTLQKEKLRQSLLSQAQKADEAAASDRLALAKMFGDDDYKDRRMDNLELLTAITAQNKDRMADIAEARAGKEAKLPGEAWKAAGFAQRLKQAETAMAELNKQGYQQPTRMDALSGFGPREIQDKKYQKLQQLKRNWVNATLRPESGASISDAEFVNADLQYFPQPGDSDEVIALKAANRLQTQEALKAQGGAAYDKIPFMGTGAKQLQQMNANSPMVTVTNGSETLRIKRENLEAAKQDGYSEVP